MVLLRSLGTRASRLSRRLYPSKYCAIAEFLFLRCSSLRELVVEQNDINNVVEENNSSGSDVVMKGSSVEIQCKLLSEVSMEVPDVNENDSDKALSGGSDVGEVVSEGNENCKISSSKEKNGAGNVNTVEKPTSQSSVAAGKTGGRTAHQRRGRRRN